MAATSERTSGVALLLTDTPAVGCSAEVVTLAVPTTEEACADAVTVAASGPADSVFKPGVARRGADAVGCSAVTATVFVGGVASLGAMAVGANALALAEATPTVTVTASAT